MLLSWENEWKWQKIFTRARNERERNADTENLVKNPNLRQIFHQTLRQCRAEHNNDCWRKRERKIGKVSCSCVGDWLGQAECVSGASTFLGSTAGGGGVSCLWAAMKSRCARSHSFSPFLVLCTRDDDERKWRGKKSVESAMKWKTFSEYWSSFSHNLDLDFWYLNTKTIMKTFFNYVFSFSFLRWRALWIKMSFHEGARLARARTHFLIETNYSRRLVFDASSRTLDCLCFCFFLTLIIIMKSSYNRNFP